MLALVLILTLLLRTVRKKFEFNVRALEKWTVLLQNWGATQQDFGFSLNVCHLVPLMLQIKLTKIKWLMDSLVSLNVRSNFVSLASIIRLLLTPTLFL